MDHTLFPRTIAGPLTLQQDKERSVAAFDTLQAWALTEDARRASAPPNKVAVKSATDIARAQQQQESEQSDYSGIKLTE